MARILNKDLSRGKLWNRQCYCRNSLSCHESIAPTRQPYRLHNCNCKGKKRSWGKRTYLTAPVPHSHHPPFQEGWNRGQLGSSPDYSWPPWSSKGSQDHHLLSLGLEEALSFTPCQAEVTGRPANTASPCTVWQQAQHPWHQLDPKVHCLQNLPCIHSKQPWRLLLLHLITEGEFWQRAFAAAHHLCRFLWWLLMEISVSLAQPSPLLGKKTMLPFSQFSPFVCKGKGWRGKDYRIVNNQSDLTASKSALCSVHGNSFWHRRRRNNSLHNK